MNEIEQSKFTGWAVVEMMGHRKEIGYVTTEVYGAAVLFRVDTPGLEEREFVLTAPEYAQVAPDTRSWCPAGTKVKREAVQPKSCLVAPSSLYAMNPCTEQAARAAIEHCFVRPLILVEMPSGLALPAPVTASELEEDICEDCGKAQWKCICAS